jgi:hypothetical protein
MIRIHLADEPQDFDLKIRQKGNNALLEMCSDPSAPKRRGPKRKIKVDRIEEIPADELPDYWCLCLEDLRKSYRSVCAYFGMKIHPATGLATVDHFKPKSAYPKQAYDWNNYRLASHQANTNKDIYEDVLDPFSIQDGWFVLNIGTFEVEASPDAQENKLLVESSINRLKLNDPTLCKTREEYHDRYHGLGADEHGNLRRPWPIEWLADECPFVLAELRRQLRLRPEDTTPGSGTTAAG